MSFENWNRFVEETLRDRQQAAELKVAPVQQIKAGNAKRGAAYDRGKKEKHHIRSDRRANKSSGMQKARNHRENAL